MFSKPDAEPYVIASPMEGILMKDGKPLPNAKIIRKLRWNGNDEGFVSEFYTDDEGFFSLPIHEESLALGILNQFVAKTELQIDHDGSNHEIWYSSKLSPEIHAETDGALEQLTCDIHNEELAVPMGPTAILTKCRWSNMPE